MQSLVEVNSFIGTYKYPVFGEKALEKIRNWFPVVPSPELAEIIASPPTDGHLEGRKFEDHYKYDYIGYFSKNVEDLEHFNCMLETVFGVRGKIRSWGRRTNGSSTGAILCNAALSRILMLCGAATGDKVTKEYGIPDWIMNGTPEIKSAFLRRAFSCEGCVCKKNRIGWEVKYSMGKESGIVINGYSFLGEMKGMMRELGVETTNILKMDEIKRKKDGKITVMLCFGIKTGSIAIFTERIGFDIGYKNDRLQKATTWASTVRDFRKDLSQS